MRPGRSSRVELTKGINDFTVTIVGPAGESEPSLVVRYVLDATPPKITITSPKDNAVVNGKAVTIKGKTQARTTLLARNDANGSSIAGTAEADGTFTLSLALSPGVNTIAITGTDPAGNVTETSLSVRPRVGQADGGAGCVDLPDQALEAARAGHPDGDRHRPRRQPAGRRGRHVHPEHPGHRTDHQRRQDRRRTARRRSGRPMPKGADLGQGSATVLVSSSEFGSTQDHTSSRSSSRAGRRRGARSTGSTDASLAATIAHADVALSALRDTPGRDGQVLGLPPIQHRLRHLSELPPIRRRPSSATAGSIAQRRPLRGDEIRACWEASGVADRGVPGRSQRLVPRRPTPSMIERPFGGSNSSRSDPRRPERASARRPTSGRRSRAPKRPRRHPGRDPRRRSTAGEPRWSLWGDAEV